jgi:hypothetical protein
MSVGLYGDIARLAVGNASKNYSPHLKTRWENPPADRRERCMESLGLHGDTPRLSVRWPSEGKHNVRRTLRGHRQSVRRKGNIGW